MEGVLVELTRGSGSTVRVRLDIHGDSGEGGYTPDAVETIEANARDLKLGEGAWDFERK